MTNTTTNRQDLRAELQTLETQRFDLDMKDRWSDEDRKRNARLVNRIHEIRKLLNPEPQNTLPKLRERRALEAEILRLLNTDGEIDFEQVGRLERRLAGKAPFNPDLLPRIAG